MKRGRPPASPYQHGQPHDEDHRDCHARTEHAHESRRQAQHVSPVDRTVVVSEDQVRESQHERRAPSHLKRHDDVSVASAEESEERRGCGRDPRVHPCSAHHHPEQDGRRQVEDDRDQLVRHVRSETEEAPEHPIDNDRQRRPVLVVRPEEVVKTVRVTAGEKAPFVERKNHCERPNTRYSTSATTSTTRTRAWRCRRSDDRRGLSPRRSVKVPEQLRRRERHLLPALHPVTVEAFGAAPPTNAIGRRDRPPSRSSRRDSGYRTRT